MKIFIGTDGKIKLFIAASLIVLFLAGVTPNGFYDMPKPEFLIRNLLLH